MTGKLEQEAVLSSVEKLNVDIDKNWYILHLGHPSNLGVISPIIKRHECLSWVPMFEIKSALWSKGTIKNKWCFPGYIFIGLDETISVALIGDMEQFTSVIYFLKCGDNVFRVPKREMQRMQEKVLEKQIEIERIGPCNLAIGDPVEISQGSLRGMHGVITELHGGEVGVKVSLFGGSTVVKIDVLHVSR